MRLLIYVLEILAHKFQKQPRKKLFHGVVGSFHVIAKSFIHVDNALMPKASYHA
jgi:hypothetical protein